MAGESRRELIIQHILAELSVSSPPPPTDVYRCPLNALSESVREAIVLIGPGDDSAEDATPEATENNITIDVGCVLREIPATGHTVDQDCDSMLVWCHKRIMADRTQGGLALDTHYVGTTWILEPQFDLDLVGAKMTFRITHTVALADPTQAA